MSKPHKSCPITAALLFLADDWLMDEGWHFNEAISTGISIRWCAAYIFHPRLIARLCHSRNFIYTMFPEGPFLDPSPSSFLCLSPWLLFLSPLLFFFPCHKIMLFLVCSGGAQNNLQGMIKPKAWRGYLQEVLCWRGPTVVLFHSQMARAEAGRDTLPRHSTTKHVWSSEVADI